ncbi:MAG: hypothetical protein QXN33_00175 [Candidatus Bathyarchaeia archaeon]
MGMGNRRAISAVMAIMLICLIIMTGAVGYYVFVLTQKPAPGPAPQPILGALAVTVTHLESFTRTVDPVTGASAVIYHMRNPGQWSRTGMVATDFINPIVMNATVQVVQSDNVAVGNGYKAYLALFADAGSADFVDPEATIAQNPCIVDWALVDIDSDSFLEYVFRLDVSGLGINQQSTANLRINLMHIPYQPSISINSPSDITGIGTTGTYRTIEWQLSGLSEKEGFAIARIYVTTNRTEDDYVKLYSLSIAAPSGAPASQSKLNLPVHSEQKNNYQGHFWPSAGTDYRQLPNALLQTRPVGGGSYSLLSLKVFCTFPSSGSGYAVQVTINVVLISPSGTLSPTISDTVVLSA